MPVIAEQSFDIGPKSWQYGVLYACFGLGAAWRGERGHGVRPMRRRRSCCAPRSSRSPRARGFALLRISGLSYPVGSCCSATRTSSRSPRCPRSSRRTSATKNGGGSDGAVDHGVRGDRPGRRARRRVGRQRVPRSPPSYSPARFGPSCSPRGRMPSRCEPREHPMSEGHDVAYRELRDRVRSVAEQVEPSALEQLAPATPKWRVHDVLAHLVGVPEDVVHGRLDGIASDAWTQAQVDRRQVAVGRRAPRRVGRVRPALRGDARRDAGRDHRSGDLRCRHPRARPVQRGRRGRRVGEQRGQDRLGVDRRRPHALAAPPPSASSPRRRGSSSPARATSWRVSRHHGSSCSARSPAAARPPRSCDFSWDRDPDPALLLAADSSRSPRRR